MRPSPFLKRLRQPVLCNKTACVRLSGLSLHIIRVLLMRAIRNADNNNLQLMFLATPLYFKTKHTPRTNIRNYVASTHVYRTYVFALNLTVTSITTYITGSNATQCYVIHEIRASNWGRRITILLMLFKSNWTQRRIYHLLNTFYSITKKTYLSHSAKCRRGVRRIPHQKLKN